MDHPLGLRGRIWEKDRGYLFKAHVGAADMLGLIGFPSLVEVLRNWTIVKRPPHWVELRIKRILRGLLRVFYLPLATFLSQG